MLKLHEVVPNFMPNCAAPVGHLWKMAKSLEASGVHFSNKLPLEPAFIPDTAAALRAVEEFRIWCESLCPGCKAAELQGNPGFAGKTALPSQSLARESPFGLRFNENRRELSRGQQIVDFGGHRLCWSLIKELYARYPDFYPAAALMQAAWHATGTVTVSKGTLQVHLGRLNTQFLRPLGLEAACKRDVGYVLRELPAAGSSKARTRAPARPLRKPT
jgi:hypothetical protein